MAELNKFRDPLTKKPRDILGDGASENKSTKFNDFYRLISRNWRPAEDLDFPGYTSDFN